MQQAPGIALDVSHHAVVVGELEPFFSQWFDERQIESG
jgi:hypothetical protein